jgi:hypothetical protein
VPEIKKAASHNGKGKGESSRRRKRDDEADEQKGKLRPCAFNLLLFIVHSMRAHSMTTPAPIHSTNL